MLKKISSIFYIMLFLCSVAWADGEWDSFRLDRLRDAYINQDTLTDQDLVVYDGTNYRWVNQTISATLDTTYWRNDGGSTATGDWDIGTNDFTTSGDVNAGIFKSNNYQNAAGTASIVWDAGNSRWLLDSLEAAVKIFTVSLDITGLTDGYVPYVGVGALANSPIYTDGTFTGINTTLPRSRLHVVSTPGGGMVVQSNNNTLNSFVALRFKVSSDTSTNYFKAGILFERTGAFAVGRLHFAVNNAGDTTNAELADTKMTISEAGNIGIGTVDFDGTPAIGRLTVKGTTNDGSTYAQVWRDSDEVNVASVDTDGKFLTGGATGVTLSGAAGVLTIAGVGNTNNENLTLDFEATTNRIVLSTGTSAKFIFGLDSGMADDYNFRFGNSSGTNGDVNMAWETTGNDNFQIGTVCNSATDSGYISIMNLADMGNANRSPSSTSVNPVLRIYSSDATSATDYIEFFHNQTDGCINVGSGILQLNTDLNLASGKKYKINGSDLTYSDVGAANATTTPVISSGTAAPATTPGKVGDIYVDTSNKKLYIAVGTGSSADWEITN